MCNELLWSAPSVPRIKSQPAQLLLSLSYSLFLTTRFKEHLTKKRTLLSSSLKCQPQTLFWLWFCITLIIQYVMKALQSKNILSKTTFHLNNLVMLWPWNEVITTTTKKKLKCRTALLDVCEWVHLFWTSPIFGSSSGHLICPYTSHTNTIATF